MASRSEMAFRNRHFNELVEKLNATIPALKERCVNFASSDFVHSKDLLKQLDALHCDTVSQKSDVDSLKELGEELMSILKELDCLDTPKAKSVVHNLENISRNFVDLTSLISEKRAHFEELVAQREAATLELQSLRLWINDSFSSITANNGPSLNLTVLEDQAEANSKLLAEIETRESRLKLVAEQCRTFGVCDDFSVLLDTFQVLCARVNSRDKKLQNILAKLSAVKCESEKIATWISNGCLILGASHKNGMLRLRVDELYRERIEKERSLEYIHKMGKELASDSSCTDSIFLRDQLAEIQSEWLRLNGLIVTAMSSLIRTELDDFNSSVIRLENHFGQKEVVLPDPGEASIRLSYHTVLREELSAMLGKVDLLFGRFDDLLRGQMSSSTHNQLTNEIASMQKRMAAVHGLAETRIAMLNAMLPLLNQLQMTYSDLSSGFLDIQQQIDALDIGQSDSAEHVRINQHKLNLIHQFLDGHRVAVSDIVDIGHELRSVGSDCDCAPALQLVNDITDKYEALKQSLKEKSMAQEEAFKRSFTDVTETILELRSRVQRLGDRISFADDIAANKSVLTQQLTENKYVIADLERLKLLISETGKQVKNLTESSTKEQEDNLERSEIQLQLKDLETLHSSAEFAACHRTELILAVLGAAEKFFDDFFAVSENLHDLQDRLTSQMAPGLSPEAVKLQLKELETIQTDVERASEEMEKCLRTSASDFEALGAVGADQEIRRCFDDFEELKNEISDGVKDRSIDLETALEVAESFSGYSKSVMTWLPEAERKLRSMCPIADTARAVRIQIEEFKVFRVQMLYWRVDIHHLSQFLSEMSVTSPEAVKSFAAHISDIDSRWQELVRLSNQREENLHSALIELGEIDHAIEDVMGLLQQIESDLVHFNEAYGDPRHIELHLKKVEALLKDVVGQKTIVRKLGETIEAVIKRSGRTNSPLADKRQEMLSLFSEIQACARDRRDELLCRLKEVKDFLRSIDETVKWLNSFKCQLKLSRSMGVLLDSVHLQYDKIMMACQELEAKEVEVEAILLNGQDMFLRCQQSEGNSLNKKLTQLRILLNETNAKAVLVKNTMEGHLEKVEKFHSDLLCEMKWLNSTENRLQFFRHPSKLVDRVQLQMHQLEECEVDIKAHAESMRVIDTDGTYLKYSGPMQDTIYIRNLLMSMRIRWKKLQQTAAEAHRVLRHACVENKRFFDSWKTLCDWIIETEERLLQKVMIGQSDYSKQDLDELKRFELQMSSRQPLYCMTRRQGVDMRDRCTKTDPERAIISDIIEELSRKWNQLRSLVTHRQERVADCTLLSPGCCSDSPESMLDWLKKFEIYLGDEQLIFGDVKVVALLIDQHKEYQKELFRIMDLVQNIPDPFPSGLNDLSGQLERVKATLEQVKLLNNLRQASLQEALKLAEDFQESLDDIHKWLPATEAELKFRPIPHDEDTLVRLIENHEKFHEDLVGQESNVERMTYIAEEILISCHPKAVSIIRYHMTVTQTRWQKLLQRSKTRSEQLREALNDIRRGASLEEELHLWLKETENHLKERDKKNLPNNRASVEALLIEQSQFHQRLCSRSRDIDKFLRLSGGSLYSGCKTSYNGLIRQRQGQKEIKEMSPAVNVGAEFRQKWQTLWQLSTDRKKLLEDLVAQMIQAERGELFDFDRWRSVAQDWFRVRKLRISDIFGQQDRNSKGRVTKKQFVDGMLAAKFPSSSTDLCTAFDILDFSQTGALNCREIVKAILSDYQSIPSREIPSMNESDLIKEEIRLQMSRCQCLIPFVVQRINDNKYKFGEKGKLCLVRFVNSSITVRVGGGWMTISEFMDNFDPCRVKQRPNSRSGLTSPPERPLSGRRDQLSPESVNKMPDFASVKDRGSLQKTPESSLRSEKVIASCADARPKGSVRQDRKSITAAIYSPTVSPATSGGHSTINKRKSFQERSQ